MNEAHGERLQSHLREHLPHDRSGRVAHGARANAVKGRVQADPDHDDAGAGPAGT